MADRFRGVPVEAEVTAGNGKIGGDGEFFAGAGSEQGAVVADAEAEGGGGKASGLSPDAANDFQFANGVAGWEAGQLGRDCLGSNCRAEGHCLRIIEDIAGMRRAGIL